MTPDAKESLLSSLPEWQRDARSKGIPQLGAGAVFRLPEQDFVIPTLKGGIPSHWPRAFGMDVGWKFTACVWLARDPDTGTYYVFSDYERQEAPPSIHAVEIKAKGDWIPGVIDPAAHGSSQADGQKLIDNYRALGLKITEADNSVNSGLDDLLDALLAGRLKIFETCQRLIRQMRIYRRDDKGKIVKKNDHCVDCLRYVWVSGRDRMKIRSPHKAAPRQNLPASGRAWMA